MIVTSVFTCLQNRSIGDKGYWLIKAVDDNYSVTNLYHKGHLEVIPGQKFKATVEVPEDAFVRVNDFMAFNEEKK